MAKCKYKVGLLNLQDCGKESIYVCASCNRPVCGLHGKVHENNTLCLECYVNKVPEQEGAAVDPEYRMARRRGLVYGAAAFHPYYFGSGRRYGHDDYTYFDDNYTRKASTGKEEVEKEDFQES